MVDTTTKETNDVPERVAEDSCVVFSCVAFGNKTVQSIRKALERDGIIYSYGSKKLPIGEAPLLNTCSDPTVRLLRDRMKDPEYEYPPDMYGGFM